MIKLFFGSPGCGKTTLCAYFAQKYKKQALKKALKGKKGEYDYIFSNAEIVDTNPFKKCQLDSHVFPKNTIALVDEAGVDFNSRKTLSMSSDMQEYFKKHRHYKNDLFFFSQTWEDIDCVIQRVAAEVWHCRKLGPFTLCRRIIKRVDVNDDTHKIEDMYEKQKLIKRFLPFPFGSYSFFMIYRPKYYKFFDSWEAKEKPIISGVPIVKL